LDGVAGEGDVLLGERQRLAGGDADLPGDQVELGQDPVPKKLRDAENRTANRTAVERAARPVAPAPATALAASPAAPAGPLPLPSLRKDPSLRFSEGGRALLHLLSVNAMGGERWRGLLDSVPAHRRKMVAQAARHCAETWLRFALELERRAV
ncbi:hypothetical protein AB0K09_32045, partial [Streptomyces sp. NPDC049577]